MFDDPFCKILSNKISNSLESIFFIQYGMATIFVDFLGRRKEVNGAWKRADVRPEVKHHRFTYVLEYNDSHSVHALGLKLNSLDVGCRILASHAVGDKICHNVAQQGLADLQHMDGSLG